VRTDEVRAEEEKRWKRYREEVKRRKVRSEIGASIYYGL
jgi:hypothetical protein